MRKKAFVDQRRESSGEVANAVAAEAEEDVRTAARRRNSKETPESMLVEKYFVAKQENEGRNGWMVAQK